MTLKSAGVGFLWLLQLRLLCRGRAQPDPDRKRMRSSQPGWRLCTFIECLWCAGHRVLMPTQGPHFTGEDLRLRAGKWLSQGPRRGFELWYVSLRACGVPSSQAAPPQPCMCLEPTAWPHWTSGTGEHLAAGGRPAGGLGMADAWCSGGAHGITTSKLCDPEGSGSATSCRVTVRALSLLLSVDTGGSCPLVP